MSPVEQIGPGLPGNAAGDNGHETRVNFFRGVEGQEIPSVVCDQYEAFAPDQWHQTGVAGALFIAENEMGRVVTSRVGLSHQIERKALVDQERVFQSGRPIIFSHSSPV